MYQYGTRKTVVICLLDDKIKKKKEVRTSKVRKKGVIMKIQTNLCGLEVEIKAKGLENENRFNDEDTQTFLNYMSIFAYEAAERYQERGATILAREAKEFAQSLYELLDADGYYDSLAVYNMPDADE